MSNMKGMKMAPPANASAVKTGKASGIVKAIDPKGGTITLQHGAIPSVGWPPMTMKFKSTYPRMLRGLKVGQTVNFSVSTPPIGPEVNDIRPR
jgi:Cu(I)/Ag(I) efflux system protein CusF